MIVFDTETTGLPLPSCAQLHDQPQIIDFAGIKLDRDGNEIARLQFLCNPGKPLDPEITKITGYTDADLADAGPFVEYYGALCQFFLGETSMLAHNMPFDKSMLSFELLRIGKETAFPWPMHQHCSASMYEEQFGKRPRLIQLYEHVIGRKLEQKHKAMSDAEALVEIALKEKLYVL